MRNVLVLVLVFVAFVSSQSFPPKIAWVNADAITFRVNALGQQFAGSGALQYLASKDPSKQPFLTHVSASAMGAGAEAWTQFQFAPSGADDQTFELLAVVQSPEGCMQWSTGTSPGNGTLTCSAWKQARRRQASSTWTSKCVAEESFGSVTIQATAELGAGPSDLNSVAIQGSAVGQGFQAIINFTSLLPSPPSTSTFKAPSCADAAAAVHPIKAFLRAVGITVA